MLQVSAENGEANRQKMVVASMALAHGTNHEGKYSHDYAWRATRARNPGIVNPFKAISSEDRRSEWVTYKNLNDWNDYAKKVMIEIGLAKDEPGYIREYRCFSGPQISWLHTLTDKLLGNGGSHRSQPSLHLLLYGGRVAWTRLFGTYTSVSVYWCFTPQCRKR